MGNVEIGESAKYDLEYLYNTSRTNPLQQKLFKDHLERRFTKEYLFIICKMTNI